MPKTKDPYTVQHERTVKKLKKLLKIVEDNNDINGHLDMSSLSSIEDDIQTILDIITP